MIASLMRLLPISLPLEVATKAIATIMVRTLVSVAPRSNRHPMTPSSPRLPSRCCIWALFTTTMMCVDRRCSGAVLPKCLLGGTT